MTGDDSTTPPVGVPETPMDPLDQEPIEVDLSSLTMRQLVTFHRALERGYYNRGQETSLADLATEFGVSKSALSQRLARAEEKLMRQILEELNE